LVSAGLTQLQHELDVLNADPNVRFIVMLMAVQTEITHDDIHRLDLKN